MDIPVENPNHHPQKKIGKNPFTANSEKDPAFPNPKKIPSVPKHNISLRLRLQLDGFESLATWG